MLPLYKAGDPQLFNNYRPVSLLPVIAKVFEKVMYNRLHSFLETQRVLICNQFRFRKSHSSYMALIVMINEISRAFEMGDHIVGIFLDFSKAFDIVNHHDVLLKSYTIMVLEEMHWNGSRVICVIDSSLSHTMVVRRVLILSSVVFLKGLSLDHYCS